MKIIIGGVRGSYPVAEPGFAVFGGETTAILLVADDGTQLMVDGGTGVRLLNEHLAPTSAEAPLGVLLTHYHLDHLAGLPGLRTAHEPSAVVKVFGPEYEDAGPKEILSRIWQSPFWPVGLSDWKADITFGLSDGAPFDFGGFRVRSCPQHHFEGSLGYRVEDVANGRSIVVATDIEWRESTTEERDAFLSLCTQGGAPDLLLYDGHFFDDEYDEFKGWGHSSISDAKEIAETIGTPTLLLVHHAPHHNDEMLLQAERVLQMNNPNWGLARGGSMFDV